MSGFPWRYAPELDPTHVHGVASSPLKGHGSSSCLSQTKGIHHRKLGDSGCVLSALITCLGVITVFEHWILKDILEKTLVF